MKALALALAMSFAGVAHAQECTGDLTEGPVVDPSTKDIKVDASTDAAGVEMSAAVKPLLRPGLAAAYVIGNENIYDYVCRTIDMPAALLDQDGGTIRLVMQHETSPHDELRVIDEHIATEWTDDSDGKRGRYAGRYGWTRQSGGGDFPWVLGDNVAHTIVGAPWGWFWIDDFARFGNNQVLGGNKIQMCAHPHITARVFFYN